MTIQELANELSLKDTYLKSHWALIMKRYEGYGIILAKRGRGRTADYGIKNYGDDDIRWTAKENC